MDSHSFQSFLADKSHLWSAVSSTSEASHPAPPTFGHSLLKYFMFDKDYVNLNHGQYTQFFHTGGSTAIQLTARVTHLPQARTGLSLAL